MYEGLTAESLFSSIDYEGKGWVSEDALIKACGLNLSGEERENLIKQLDHDGDGRISLEDFRIGFSSLIKRDEKKMVTNDSRYQQKKDLRQRLSKLELASIKELLKDVNGSKDFVEVAARISEKSPEAYTIFDRAIRNVSNQVKDLIDSISHNESELQRLRIQHGEDMKRLANELDQQIAAAESASRGEGRREAEREFSMLITLKDNEIEELNQRIEDLERNRGRESSSGDHSENSEMSRVQSQRNIRRSITNNTMILDLREQLGKVQQEKRAIELELATMRTQSLLSKTSLSTLRQTTDKMKIELDAYAEKSSQWAAKESDLKAQIEKLHEINLCLQDANDELRAALEQSSSTQSKPLPVYDRSATAATLLSSSDVKKNLRNMQRKNQSPYNPIENHYELADFPPMNGHSADSFCEDSGVSSSLRGITDIDSEIDYESVLQSGYESRKLSQNTVRSSAIAPVPSRRSQIPLKSTSTEHSIGMSYASFRGSRNTNDTDHSDNDPSLSRSHSSQRRNDRYYERDTFSRPEAEGSNKAANIAKSSGNDYEIMSNLNDITKHSEVRESDLFIPSSRIQRNMTPSNSHPTQIYKIILAGDSSVGKTSFILRLCQNEFKLQTMTTISIDVQRINLVVDNENIIIELWDTAGQERFQSLTRSFYRKADGVILLYDCTLEKSYLSVRNWIQSIQDYANEDIPVFLVGNKIDLRESYRNARRNIIEYEDGKRLAQEQDVCFIETSAKDGTNIRACVVELARFLRFKQSLEKHENSTNLISADVHKRKLTTCCNV